MVEVQHLAASTCIDMLGAPAMAVPAAGGPERQIRILALAGERLVDGIGGTRMITDGLLADVMVASWPAPAPGDAIYTARGMFRVRSVYHPDPDGVIWRLDCVREDS